MPQRHSDEISSAVRGVSVTVNTATLSRCRAVRIGTPADYEVTWDGTTWVLLRSCNAGETLGYQIIGIRLYSGGAAPAEGDVVFLY